MIRQGLTVVAVAALTVGPEARPAYAAPSPAEVVAARTAYELGVGHFREKRYSDAIAEFNKAYRLDPNPVLVFNMARAFEELKDFAAAIEFYRKYLEMAPEADDRPQVEATLRTLELLQARAQAETRVPLTVTSRPDGAKVHIDGREAGVTPLQVEVTPGGHVVSLEKAGFERASIEVQLESGKPARHEVQLLVAPEVPPPVAPGPDRTWAWVALGTGGALLAGGAFFGWQALDKHDQADALAADGDDAGLDAAKEDGQRYALFADGLYVAGAAGIVTGLVLYLTAGDEPAPVTASGSAVTFQWP